MKRASIYRILMVLFIVVAYLVDSVGVYSEAGEKSENKIVYTVVKPPLQDTENWSTIALEQPTPQPEPTEPKAPEMPAQAPTEPELKVAVKDDLKQLIKNAAKKYDIPEELLFSQAYLESNFNANLTGDAGDIGLMQVLPTTANELNRTTFKIAHFKPSMLYDPELNLDFACAYLKYMREQTNSWQEALTAYNMGIGGLIHYKKAHQGSSYSQYYKQLEKKHLLLYEEPLRI